MVASQIKYEIGPWKAKERTMTAIMTVKKWWTADEALIDAENRINKAIWHHIPTGQYAIGDYDDLPHSCDLNDNGFWYELSRSDLIADVENASREHNDELI